METSCADSMAFWILEARRLVKNDVWIRSIGGFRIRHGLFGASLAPMDPKKMTILDDDVII